LYPSYTEWKKLVRETPNERDFLWHLADMYERVGEIVLAEAIRRIAIHDRDKAPGEAPEESSGGSMLMESGDIDTEKDSCSRAIRLVDAAVAERPNSFWSWHNLCRVYIRKGDVVAAIGACSKGNTRLASNPWPILVATNLYAARNDYDRAILMYMEFFPP
jgi:predicted Zn-dependent protease